MAESADADADELSLAPLSISELSLTERLPFDLLEPILSHAEPPAICAAGGVCRALRRAAHAEALWRTQLQGRWPHRLGLTEAGIKCAAAATDPSADAWELEDDDVGAGRALRRMCVRLWAREPCTAELVRRDALPYGAEYYRTKFDARLSNPFVGERAWVIVSDGAPSSVALLARAATGRGDELVFQARSWAGGELMLAEPAGPEAGDGPGSLVRAIELPDDGLQLMRLTHADRTPANEPPRVCFSICRRPEAIGRWNPEDPEGACGRRLGPIESFDHFSGRGDRVVMDGVDVTHVSFELLRQVSLPVGVCD